jgi:hypothetical protein
MQWIITEGILKSNSLGDRGKARNRNQNRAENQCEGAPAGILKVKTSYSILHITYYPVDCRATSAMTYGIWNMKYENAS